MKARIIRFFSRVIRYALRHIRRGRNLNPGKALTAGEWENLYNLSQLEPLLQRIREHNVSSWTNEIVSLTQENDNVLEIGSGSGESSLMLARNNRNATAMDFSRGSLALIDKAAETLNVKVKTVFADCREKLPFAENEFDVIFQAGLLEHFEKDERIGLLKNWKPYCRYMVSMIPNAASVAYRAGKQIMEQNGTWIVGKELPQYSLADEFSGAGFRVLKEYTIDVQAALTFLPRFHYLRRSLARWHKENHSGDICGQGYLLVTVGEKAGNGFL